MVFPGISGAPLLIKPPSGMKVQDVFNVNVYAGDGVNGRSFVTGIDPSNGSLLWFKRRNSTSNHILTDNITRTSEFLYLNSASDAARASLATSTGSMVFDATGYTIGSNAAFNANTGPYVAYQWKRSPKFFDIVSYTGNGTAGNSIPHALGIKPSVIMVKSVTTVQNWQVYSSEIGASGAGNLNTTGNLTGGGVFTWNSVEPTATEFTVGSSAATNASGVNYIAYLFAGESGNNLIRHGLYTGNGNVNGPQVDVGWKPQFVLIKVVDLSGTNWNIVDAARGGSLALPPNLNTSESTFTNAITFNDTGFKVGVTGNDFNNNGRSYFYLAIREAM